MLRIAVIGCGEHSRIAHGPPLARLAAERPGEIELIAACDLSRERADAYRQDFNFKRAHADVDQMLAQERPDAVIAVLPVRHIAAMAEKLLTLKMPCSIEKPMGATIAEVRRLATIATQTGTPHMVSVNRRFSVHLNQAKAWSLAHGPLRFVSASMLRVKRTEPDFVWETGMHVVDALRHVVGEFSDFHFTANSAPPAACPWYAAQFGFAQGGVGKLEILPSCGAWAEVFELMGDGYRARVSFRPEGASSLECWRDGKIELSEESPENEPAFIGRGEYAEATAFINALLAGRPPRPTVNDILPSAEICARLLARP